LRSQRALDSARDCCEQLIFGAAPASPAASACLMFEPGPWDKREGIESAHVFSKQRKLLYGKVHHTNTHARATVLLPAARCTQK